ncbi:MAG: hypothetical protein KAI66_17680 [Lentisphaeria bacterium]|nr:hypothetical protein [Lentisphaeria bacterium]
MAGSNNKKLLEGIVLALLVVALLGGAFFVGGNRLTQTEGAAKTPLGTREVGEALVRFSEGAPIVPKATRMRGLAASPDGTVYLSADFTVIELSPDGTERMRHALDSAARCLAVGADKRLYLGCGDHVEVIEPRGESKSTAWESLGERAFITAIAVGANRVFIADAGNRTLWVRDLEGQVIRDLGGTPGSDAPRVPGTYYDVAYSPVDNCFWVTDAGQHGVIRYSPDGKILGRWGKASEKIEDFSGCCNPTQIAVMPDGKLVTVEKKPDLVKLHTSDGTLDCVVAPPKAFIRKTFVPDVVADVNGRVIVLDPKRKQLRVFVRKQGKGTR